MTTKAMRGIKPDVRENALLREALELHLAFLKTLNSGWLGKTTGDIGLLNAAYLASTKALNYGTPATIPPSVNAKRQWYIRLTKRQAPGNSSKQAK